MGVARADLGELVECLRDEEVKAVLVLCGVVEVRLLISHAKEFEV